MADLPYHEAGPNGLRLITRQEAMAQGLARYFDGTPCKRGHVAERYVNKNSRSRCTACVAGHTAKWKAANPEKFKEIQKACIAAWLAANKERDSARRKAWRAANPEKNRAKTAAWRKQNPEYHRMQESKRRARKRGAGGDLSRDLPERLLKLQKGRCAVCFKLLGSDYQMDHIHPLALGGSNTDDNIQLLHSVCNYRKGARPPVEYMQSRGLLL